MKSTDRKILTVERFGQVVYFTTSICGLAKQTELLWRGIKSGMFKAGFGMFRGLLVSFLFLCFCLFSFLDVWYDPCSRILSFSMAFSDIMNICFAIGWLLVFSPKAPIVQKRTFFKSGDLQHAQEATGPHGNVALSLGIPGIPLFRNLQNQPTVYLTPSTGGF